MKEKYDYLIDSASTLITDELKKNMEVLLAQGDSLDKFVLDLLREVGLSSMEKLYQEVSTQTTTACQAEGYHIERHESVSYKTIFGEIAVESPYLKKTAKKKGSGP